MKTLTFALLFVAATAAAQTPAAPHTLTIAGTGNAPVVNNRATFTVGITTSAKTVREALDENTARTSRVVAALKGAGIAPAEMQTSTFDIGRPADGLNKGLYVVSHAVTVTREDRDSIGALLQLCIEAGATEANGVRYFASETGAARDAALKNAYADAHARGEKLAAAAGQSLGQALSMSVEHSFAATGLLPYYEVRVDAQASAPEMQRGTASVTETVTVVFELK